jgi:hypothetical protein
VFVLNSPHASAIESNDRTISAVDSHNAFPPLKPAPDETTGARGTNAKAQEFLKSFRQPSEPEFLVRVE